MGESFNFRKTVQIAAAPTTTQTTTMIAMRADLLSPPLEVFSDPLAASEVEFRLVVDEV